MIVAAVAKGLTKGETTKSSVLGAALRMASKVGLEGVTIGTLAEHVGLSKSGLFAHFSSKENLQIAILEEAERRFVDCVLVPALKEKRGEPRVRTLFDHWITWAKADFQPGGCIFVSASVELDDRPGPVRDKLVASQRDWLEALAQAARIGIAEKHFRKDLEVHGFAQHLYSIAYGFHFMSRLLRDPRAEARARASFELLLRDARGFEG